METGGKKSTGSSPKSTPASTPPSPLKTAAKPLAVDEEKKREEIIKKHFELLGEYRNARLDYAATSLRFHELKLFRIRNRITLGQEYVKKLGKGESLTDAEKHYENIKKEYKESDEELKAKSESEKYKETALGLKRSIDHMESSNTKIALKKMNDDFEKQANDHDSLVSTTEKLSKFTGDVSKAEKDLIDWLKKEDEAMIMAKRVGAIIQIDANRQKALQPPFEYTKKEKTTLYKRWKELFGSEYYQETKEKALLSSSSSSSSVIPPVASSTPTTKVPPSLVTGAANATTTTAAVTSPDLAQQKKTEKEGEAIRKYLELLKQKYDNHAEMYALFTKACKMEMDIIEKRLANSKVVFGMLKDGKSNAEIKKYRDDIDEIEAEEESQTRDERAKIKILKEKSEEITSSMNSLVKDNLRSSESFKKELKTKEEQYISSRKDEIDNIEKEKAQVQKDLKEKRNLRYTTLASEDKEVNLNERKEIKEEAKKKAQEEEEARKKAQEALEEEAARKKAQEEEEATKKAQEEEATKKKAQEEEEATKKKAQEEEEAKKKAQEEEEAKKKAQEALEEETAKKKAQEALEEEEAKKKAQTKKEPPFPATTTATSSTAPTDPLDKPEKKIPIFVEYVGPDNKRYGVHINSKTTVQKILDFLKIKDGNKMLVTCDGKTLNKYSNTLVGDYGVKANETVIVQKRMFLYEPEYDPFAPDPTPPKPVLKEKEKVPLEHMKAWEGPPEPPKATPVFGGGGGFTFGYESVPHTSFFSEPSKPLTGPDTTTATSSPFVTTSTDLPLGSSAAHLFEHDTSSSSSSSSPTSFSHEDAFGKIGTGSEKIDEFFGVIIAAQNDIIKLLRNYINLRVFEMKRLDFYMGGAGLLNTAMSKLDAIPDKTPENVMKFFEKVYDEPEIEKILSAQHKKIIDQALYNAEFYVKHHTSDTKKKSYIKIVQELQKAKRGEEIVDALIEFMYYVKDDQIKSRIYNPDWDRVLALPTGGP